MLWRTLVWSSICVSYRWPSGFIRPSAISLDFNGLQVLNVNLYDEVLYKSCLLIWIGNRRNFYCLLTWISTFKYFKTQYILNFFLVKKCHIFHNRRYSYATDCHILHFEFFYCWQVCHIFNSSLDFFYDFWMVLDILFTRMNATVFFFFIYCQANFKLYFWEIHWTNFLVLFVEM